MSSNPFQPLFSGGNRSFNQGFNHQHANPVFGYSMQTGVGFTGWVPNTLTDEGRLRVDAGNISVSSTFTGGNVNIINTEPIPVSGNFSTTITIGDIAVTGGNININNFDILTGQVSQIQTSLNNLTGTISSKWQKISTNGYSQNLIITGHLLASKINGYNNITGNYQENFIQIFDDVVQTGNPINTIIAVSRQNWFIDLAEGGVEFYNGLTLSTSFDPILSQTGDNTMFASVIYKMI